MMTWWLNFENSEVLRSDRGLFFFFLKVIGQMTNQDWGLEMESTPLEVIPSQLQKRTGI